MLRYGLCLLAGLASATVVAAEETKVVITVERPDHNKPDTKPPFHGKRPTVDVALLLDTSNSMDGLINQAKSQLWTIVQQFAKAKKAGQTPHLRVALFEYGNNNLPAAEGYIRQVVPLTDNLDDLSEALFSLTTNGGDEYCGQVIDQALVRLDWSSEPNGYKAIFIAGNEPFTQGSVDYRESCSKAIQAGVVVNTIHCGAKQAGVDGHWQDGANLAEGKSLNIDQDRAVVHIDCPQDKIIIELNTELNKTYLWYGAQELRDRYAQNQVAQDANAEALSPSVASSRAAAKVTGAYNNFGRCLVETFESDKEILSKLKPEELPEPLRGKSVAEQQKYLETLADRRAELKKQIGQLSVERETYAAAERKRLTETTGAATLGDAVVTAIQAQLSDSGFEVEATN